MSLPYTSTISSDLTAPFSCFLILIIIRLSKSQLFMLDRTSSIFDDNQARAPVQVVKFSRCYALLQFVADCLFDLEEPRVITTCRFASTTDDLYDVPFDTRCTRHSTEHTASYSSWHTRPTVTTSPPPRQPGKRSWPVAVRRGAAWPI